MNILVRLGLMYQKNQLLSWKINFENQIKVFLNLINEIYMIVLNQTRCKLLLELILIEKTQK